MGVTEMSEPDDADLAVVLDVLRGAYRTPSDPDVALAQLLHRLGTADPAQLIEAARVLVRDAYPD